MTSGKKRLLSWAGFVALIAFVVMWAAGAFRSGEIQPGRAPEPPGEPAPTATAKAERAEVGVVEEAVGTVHSRTRVVVSSQVPGRLVTVVPQIAERVHAGDVLITLDDRELAAGLAGAREALGAAEAAKRQAEQARVQGEARLTLAQSRHDRVKSFRERGAATDEQYEAVQAELATARAGVADADAAITAAAARIAQAKEVVTAAAAALDHTRIACPLDGVVAERNVEPGDLAWPGRPLLVVLDPAALRLDAVVREGLISGIREGAVMHVEIPSAGATVQGTVSEIVPAADPRTRTFEVRVAIPATPGVLPGMFGRLRLPVAKRDVVRVPDGAIVRVGQLETVLVQDGGRWTRRLVRTGATLEGGAVEVLAGLTGGETVGLSSAGRPGSGR